MSLRDERATGLRVLVGGVGYRNLADHSVGVEVIDRLLERTWPAHVVVEDLSYNPIAVVQRLEAEPPEGRFARAVVIAAISRAGRPSGTVEAYRWDNVLPAPSAIQASVAEAVTGVISVDNTLVIGRHFGGLPEEVAVVEVEPLLEEFGDTFSAVVAGAFDAVCELVTRLALSEEAARSLPRDSLGGRRRSVAEES